MITQEAPRRKILGIPIKWLLRLTLAGVCLILVIGVVAPFINAGAFKGRIQACLEQALGRKVEIEAVHFSLFTGPGFRLDNVAIAEDPHYGLEVFAYVPTLELRVRLDKLLMGQIRPQGLRLVDGSINLVKADDGTWNVVKLVERLGAPRRGPLNFVPAVEVSNGRLDFKLGTRKTTLYITETAVSIYPESSGKIYFKFEGSPARTDRAGNGFGHFAGTANWYLKPASATANQLEADVNLQPSSLSELTTLFQGHDLGVHGTVTSHVTIAGPLSNLQAEGDLQLQDVHRWDLLPSPGDRLQVGFHANLDLSAHTIALSTTPIGAAASPVTLQLRAKDFMTTPQWSVIANLRKAPLASLLPLARRMGMGLPSGLQMDGMLDGAIGLSNAGGVEGGVAITNALANIPNVPPLRSATANVTISGEKIHVDPAILEADSGGTLRAGGDFNFSTQDMSVDINADQFSIPAFRETTNAWFGAPEALALAQDGRLSGHFEVKYSAEMTGQIPSQKPTWTGQVQLLDATLRVPGVAVPVKRFQGRVTFEEKTFDLPRMTGLIEQMPFSGSSHYNADAKRPEHLRIEFPQAELSQLEAVLGPTLSDDSLLSHLPFTRRSIPEWLAARNMEGEVRVSELNLEKHPFGAFDSHFVWQGTALQLTSLQAGMAGGKVQGTALIGLSAPLPRYRFNLKLNGLVWNGGALTAAGVWDSSGTGAVAIQNLKGSGEFSGEGITLPGSEPFSTVAGQFRFAFDGETPALKLTNLQAFQNEVEWLGDAVSDSDGRLHVNLTSGDRKLLLTPDLHAPDVEPRTAANSLPQ